MTGPSRVWPVTSGRGRGARLSSSQVDDLRTLLLAAIGRQVGLLTTCERALVGDSFTGTAGLDRAMAALRMYGAREAIEDIEDALARIDLGTYGTCRACDLLIPFDDLEMIPQARLCAACIASAAPVADRSSGLRLGERLGEHMASPPVCSPRHQLEPDVHTSESPRGNPVAR